MPIFIPETPLKERHLAKVWIWQIYTKGGTHRKNEKTKIFSNFENRMF